jgi:hypothetical protein
VCSCGTGLCMGGPCAPDGRVLTEPKHILHLLFVRSWSDLCVKQQTWISCIAGLQPMQ